MKKKLPIGCSTLEKVINDNYIYIDKTRFVKNLVEDGRYYFISRPRRFGKSFLIDTLKQAFLGNKHLFEGLYLENNWDWDTKYPVIHFDFADSSANINSNEWLIELIEATLLNHAKAHQIKLTGKNYGLKFTELIRKLYQKYNQSVVILVDEYDKPILDVIDDKKTAITNRETLKSLYNCIKKNDVYLKFVLLTGVSKFSQVNLFSGLNNLNDISLNSRYADICGYTQTELEDKFSTYIQDGKVDLAKLKQWYNGYNFLGTDSQKVYNPFDILLFFNNNYLYRGYWFETATPTFLVKLMQSKHYFIPDMESVIVSGKALATFDVENIPLVTLLFQTGYLTIKEVTSIGMQLAYKLSYPNLEVKLSLNDSLAEIGADLEIKYKTTKNLDEILLKNQFDSLGQLFTSHFASIPNNWYVNNNINEYEGFYASIVYSFLCALGYDLVAEDVTNQGRIDLTIKMPDKILILEFKLSKYGSAVDALAQIKAKNYPDKYKSLNLPIYLIGISFDENQRNLADYAVEKLDPKYIE